MKQSVDLWVCPLCPWAWIASRWLLEAEKVRDIETKFHVMSLSVLNEGRDLPEEYVDLIKRGWEPARVLIAAEQRYGNEVVKPLYSAMGERFHVQGNKEWSEVIPESLQACDLDPAVAEAAENFHAGPRHRQHHVFRHPGVDTLGHEGARAEAAERYREYTAILAGYPECIELTKWREYLEQLKIKWKLEEYL